MYAFRVNDKVLTQEGQEYIEPIDTVLDNPLEDYAVLVRGVNGNLGSQNGVGNDTKSTLEVVKNVYAECNIISVQSGMTVSLKDSNNSQLTSLSHGLFDPGDCIGILVSGARGQYRFFKNGVPHPSNPSGTVSTANGIYIGGDNAGGYEAHAFNFGQQPYKYATTNADGSVTLNYAEFKEPYSIRANTDQEWSAGAGGSWDGTYTVNKVFDGDISTNGAPPFTVNASGNVDFGVAFPSISTLKMYAALSSQNGNGIRPGGIVINGVDITEGAGSSIWAQSGGTNDKGWVDIDVSTIGNKLETIALTAKDNDGSNQPVMNLKSIRLRLMGVSWLTILCGITLETGAPMLQATATNKELPNSDPPRGVLFMFDGDLNTINSPNSSNVTTTTTFTNFPSGSIEIYVTISGSSVITTSGGNTLTAAGWRPIADTTLTSIQQYQSGSSPCYVHGFKVNGKVLVDSGLQWDTTRNWSATGTVTGTMDNANKAFDGDFGTFASNYDNSVNDPATYTFNPPITGITSLRVYGQSTQSAVPL